MTQTKTKTNAKKLHNNSLIESEAKPECFNFTFNPKEEEQQLNHVVVYQKELEE